jgi:hypothetical protein
VRHRRHHACSRRRRPHRDQRPCHLTHKWCIGTSWWRNQRGRHSVADAMYVFLHSSKSPCTVNLLCRNAREAWERMAAPADPMERTASTSPASARRRVPPQPVWRHTRLVNAKIPWYRNHRVFVEIPWLAHDFILWLASIFLPWYHNLIPRFEHDLIPWLAHDLIPWLAYVLRLHVVAFFLRGGIGNQMM